MAPRHAKRKALSVLRAEIAVVERSTNIRLGGVTVAAARSTVFAAA